MQAYPLEYHLVGEQYWVIHQLEVKLFFWKMSGTPQNQQRVPTHSTIRNTVSSWLVIGNSLESWQLTFPIMAPSPKLSIVTAEIARSTSRECKNDSDSSLVVCLVSNSPKPIPLSRLFDISGMLLKTSECETCSGFLWRDLMVSDGSNDSNNTWECWNLISSIKAGLLNFNSESSTAKR